MKVGVSIISLLLGSLLLASCVHRDFEEPSAVGPDLTPSVVNIELHYFDTEMGLHTVVTKDRSRAPTAASPASRHIIRIYGQDRVEVASVLVTDEADNATVTRSHSFRLVPGKYTAVCWTDYASEGDTDWHYDTSGFPDVELRYETDTDGYPVHRGNTPWRDAYNGSRCFTVCADGTTAYDDGSATGTTVPVEMRRPLARFLFEATDLEEFADAHSLSIPSSRHDDPFPGYTITFRYADYMPSTFSVSADAPTDSRIGASFLGEPRPASTTGTVEIGSDFVFVHPLETAVNVAMEVRNKTTGNTVARAGPFTVPLFRNRLTIVRGRFLTSTSGQGAVIDPGFAGEYNIEVK